MMELYSDKTPDSLRAHADGLDQDADQLVREANARADELRRRARDYRHTAQMLDEARQPSLCNNCGNHIVRDSLGWRHPHPTECAQPVPANVGVPAEPVQVSPESLTRTVFDAPEIPADLPTAEQDGAQQP